MICVPQTNHKNYNNLKNKKVIKQQYVIYIHQMAVTWFKPNTNKNVNSSFY